MVSILWNLSNQDTDGPEGSVIVSEVSSFQRLKVLGVGKVSCLERCPQFHCNSMPKCTIVHIRVYENNISCYLLPQQSQ